MEIKIHNSTLKLDMNCEEDWMRKWTFSYDFSKDEKNQEVKHTKAKNIALLLGML